MTDLDKDPNHMREIARRYRTIAEEHEAGGSTDVAKKMRQAAQDIEAAADEIERAKGVN